MLLIPCHINHRRNKQPHFKADFILTGDGRLYSKVTNSFISFSFNINKNRIHTIWWQHFMSIRVYICRWCFHRPSQLISFLYYTGKKIRRPQKFICLFHLTVPINERILVLLTTSPPNSNLERTVTEKPSFSPNCCSVFVSPLLPGAKAKITANDDRRGIAGIAQ